MPTRPPDTLHEKMLALSPRIDPFLYQSLDSAYQTFRNISHEARTRNVISEIQPYTIKLLSLILRDDPFTKTGRNRNIAELLARSSQWAYEFYLKHSKTVVGQDGKKRLVDDSKGPTPFDSLDCIPADIAETIQRVQKSRNTIQHPNDGEFIVPSIAETELLLEKMLLALEWFYIDSPFSPGVSSPYRDHWHYEQKIVGLPPGGARNFTGRESDLGELEKAFLNPSIRLINIIGRGGWGKTALLSKFCERIEEGVYCKQSPVDDPPVSIVYIDCRRAPEILQIGAPDWLTEKLFTLADEVMYCRGALVRLWRDPDSDLRSKLSRLMADMKDDNYVLVFDNFESVLDDNNRITDEGIRTFLELLLSFENRIRVITTTREKPILGNRVNERGRVCDKALTQGLSEEDAVALLRSFAEEEPYNEQLACASRSQLKQIAKLCDGIPQALVYVHSATDQNGRTLNDMLHNLPLFGNEVVNKLCEDNFLRASEDRQFVLQILSVFARRIPKEGIEFVVNQLYPEQDPQEALAWLQRARFVHYKAERGTSVYAIHNIDREFAYRKISPDCQARLHEAVADYYDIALETPDGYWWMAEQVNPQADVRSPQIREDDEEEETEFQSSYLRFSRYEERRWQILAEDWCYHSGMSANRAKVRKRLTRRVFDAIWWWDEYERYSFCDTILSLWRASQIDGEDQAFLDLIEGFRAVYPRKWPLEGVRDREQGRCALQYLEQIRRQLGLSDGDRPDEEDLLSLQALTTSYLADLYGLDSESPESVAKATHYYRETYQLFQSMSKAFQWCQSYILYEFAEFLSGQGRYAEAIRTAVEAYRIVERQNGLSSHEPEMRIYRIVGDVYDALGDRGKTWAAYTLSMWETYCFHDNYQGKPNGPDSYTILAHRYTLRCLVRRLQAWNEADPGFAVRCARELHEFWTPLWVVQSSAPAPADDAMLSLWIATADPKLIGFLAPSVPAVAEDDKQMAGYRAFSAPVIQQITESGITQCLMQMLPELFPQTPPEYSI